MPKPLETYFSESLGLLHSQAIFLRAQVDEQAEQIAALRQEIAALKPPTDVQDERV